MSEEASVYVDCEYGKLTEVVVGIPFGMNPSLEAPWLEDALEVLIPEEREYTRKTAGLLWKEMVDPRTGKTETEMLESENEEFIGVLKEFGVKVYRPFEITPEFIEKHYGKEILVNGYSQTFPRDNIAVIGNNVIELNLRTPMRKTDISGFSQILKEKCDNTVRRFSMPHVEPLMPQNEDVPRLEGGDVLVLGKTVLVGNTLNAAVGSNEAGCEWLRSVLGDGYEVIRIPMVKEILHLDCILSIPRDGLAIMCKEAFVEGIPKIFNGWDIIEMSLYDSSTLALNGVPIDGDHYIMGWNDNNDNERLKSELEKRGISVRKVYFNTHNDTGGSLRCATQPLKRIVRCETE